MHDGSSTFFTTASNRIFPTSELEGHDPGLHVLYGPNCEQVRLRTTSTFDRVTDHREALRSADFMIKNVKEDVVSCRYHEAKVDP